MVTLGLMVDRLYDVEDDQLMQPASEPPETTRNPQGNEPLACAICKVCTDYTVVVYSVPQLI